MPRWIGWNLRIRGKGTFASDSLQCCWSTDLSLYLHGQRIVIHFRIHDQTSQLRREPELLARFGGLSQQERHGGRGSGKRRRSWAERKSASDCESVLGLRSGFLGCLYELCCESVSCR